MKNDQADPLPPHLSLPLKVFDDDLDGLITVRKLMAVYKRAVEKQPGQPMPTEAELKALLATADFDKDAAPNDEELGRVFDEVGV